MGRSSRSRFLRRDRGDRLAAVAGGRAGVDTPGALTGRYRVHSGPIPRRYRVDKDSRPTVGRGLAVVDPRYTMQRNRPELGRLSHSIKLTESRTAIMSG